jgi:Skp family chaperone for outer membrane proteins
MFSGFCLGMLFSQYKIRKVMKATKKLLEEIPDKVEEGEDEKENLKQLIFNQGKLQYIKGRLDITSELLN